MSTIRTVVQIERPKEVVYDYVTTPENWLQWHPSSVSLDGARDHSLQVGEQVTEKFMVAGRPGSVTWTVTERQRPDRWAIRGQVPGAGDGTITYRLSRNAVGTRFEREFRYQMSNWVLAALDWLVVRRRITSESALALQQLKRILESPDGR